MSQRISDLLLGLGVQIFRAILNLSDSGNVKDGDVHPEVHLTDKELAQQAFAFVIGAPVDAVNVRESGTHYFCTYEGEGDSIPCQSGTVWLKGPDKVAIIWRKGKIDPSTGIRPNVGHTVTGIKTGYPAVKEID